MTLIFDKLVSPLNICFKRCFKSLLSQFQRKKTVSKELKTWYFPNSAFWLTGHWGGLMFFFCIGKWLKQAKYQPHFFVEGLLYWRERHRSAFAAQKQDRNRLFFLFSLRDVESAESREF